MSTPKLLVEPGLFGLQNANRDFTKEDDWGKNKFNSSFPASLACYMGYKGLDAVYLCLDKMEDKTFNKRSLSVTQKRITIEELLGMKELSPNLFFSFETQYIPYSPFINAGSLPRVDLVTLDTSTSQPTCLRGLEVKLTVLPDNQTYKLAENAYSSEIVIRPDTIVYLALSIAQTYSQERKILFDLLDPVCQTIRNWSSAQEVFPKLAEIINALNKVLLAKLERQSPFVMQPIWKTIGKRTVLSDDCFDMFVWSDFGFTRLFVDTALKVRLNNSEIKRPARAVFWLTKMLYDFASNGQFNHKRILEEITYGPKNDKAFSITGRLTYPYLKSVELTHPRVPKQALKEIILGDGYKFLSPERRLDAAIVTTSGIFLNT